MAAWNVTICSSASSVLKVNSKNRVERVLGMAPSPQVSPSAITRGGGGENYGPSEEQQQVRLSPKRGYYAAFTEMADEEMVVEEEEIVGGAGGVVLKKRRLTVDQVRFLESSFESENKLEPERKAQIAQKLGLQPRQVAVWFQNRRARSKSKQLERDFLALKADYHAILLENERLQAEVDRLTAQLQEGSVPLKGVLTEELAKEATVKEAKSSDSNLCSSSNCGSDGPTLKVDAQLKASTASGGEGMNGHGNEALDGEEQLSPCTILADVNVNVNVSASVLPLPSAAAVRTKVAESVSSYEALVSEEIHFLTNCMQQAYAHQLVDFYTDAFHYDSNGLFLTSSLDDTWSD